MIRLSMVTDNRRGVWHCGIIVEKNISIAIHKRLKTEENFIRNTNYLRGWGNHFGMHTYRRKKIVSARRNYFAKRK